MKCNADSIFSGGRNDILFGKLREHCVRVLCLYHDKGSDTVWRRFYADLHAPSAVEKRLRCFFHLLRHARQSDFAKKLQ